MKKLFTLLLCLGTATSLFAQPANNDCTSPEVLTVTTDGTCSSPQLGTNVDATASGVTPSPSCSTFGSGVDNWYSLTIPASGDVTVEMSSAGGPTDWAMQLYTFTGSCSELTPVECDDDDGPGLFPLVELTGRTPGEILYVRVFEFGNDLTGEFNICAYTVNCTTATGTATAVDDCANSDGFLIDVDISDFGTATSITASNDADGTTLTLDAATSTGQLGPFASGTDVVVTLTPDDDVNCVVDLPSVTLNCPPPNDACADAISIPVTLDGSCSSPVMGTNEAATASGEMPDPSCSTFGTGQDNWHSVVVPANGELTVEMTSAGGPTDWGMSIYSGACGGLTEIECDDDDGIGNFPLIALTGQTPGDVLLVRVFEFGNNQQGAYNICAHTLLCTPATGTATSVDDCANSDGFLIDVAISDFGSATTITASNDADGTTLTLDAATSTGQLGPFASGTDVIVTLTPDDDVNCVVELAAVSFDCPPPNDACANAIALTDVDGLPTADNGVEYNTREADPAQSVATPTCNGFTGNADDDIWFTVTAPAGAGDVITITGTTSGFTDIVLALYTNDCANLILLDCSDSGNPEEIVYTVPASRSSGSSSAVAETFLVQAFAYGAGGGDIAVTADVQSTALPVELTSFTGQSMEKANKLSWLTAREEAADRYLVERSALGSEQWEAIGEVLAAGDSETETAYELMDEQPLVSALYRLKMVDLDGSFEYSHVVQLENSSVLNDKLSVFPIPANDVVNINFTAEASGEAVLSLTDMMGRTISQRSLQVTEGLQTQTIDLSTAASGAYLVRVNVDGRQMVKRIVRQ